MAFYDAGAVLQGQAGCHGVDVELLEPGEPADRLRCVTLHFADPVLQQMAGAVAYQIGEALRDLPGAGDVRAGQADLAEPDLVVLSPRLTPTHDPGSDRAWARNRRRRGYRSAVSKSRDVSADRLNRALESPLTDFTEEPAGVRAAVEEAGLQVGVKGCKEACSTVPGGFDEHDEIGVPEVPHCLAVHAQSARDRADRPSFVHQVEDVGVPVEGSLDDGDLRQRGRLIRHPGVGDRGVRSSQLLSVFPQAGAVLVTCLLHHNGQILQQMPPVGHFDRPGGRPA
nr:hypothetical protein [Streptomyces flavotricini]